MLLVINKYLQKHLAKGQDLQDACVDIEALEDSSKNLKDKLSAYAERLELTRERIEGAARLHHLLGLHIKEDDVQHEMQKLAEKIGVPGLVDRCKENLNKNYKMLATSTPISAKNVPAPAAVAVDISPVINVKEKHLADSNHCECWRNVSDHVSEQRSRKSTSLPRSLNAMQHAKHDRCMRITSDEDDEEEHSKLADSGLGYCDRCEGNEKLIRTCSCQSFEDPTNASSKR